MIKKIPSILLLLTFTLLWVYIACAEDLYVAQTTAGSDDGTSCANAKSASWFNTEGSWGTGAGKISAGDTVHLCGTFTGTVGSTILEVQGSGTSGSPITIQAETDAVLTSPASEYGIHASGKSYITFDGGSNGIIRATANGSSLANQAWATGIEVYSCSNIIIKNWNIQNIFVHVEGDGGSEMRGVGVASWYSSDVTIENNTISHACFGIDLVYNSSGQSNIIVQNNAISYFNIAVHVASAEASATISNVQILNNTMHDTVNWDDPANNYHHNAVHAYAVQSGTSISGLTIANNYVYGAWSTDGHNTSAFYIEPDPGTATSVLIYNNIIAPSSYSGGNAFIYSKSGASPSIYNNTIVGTDAQHAIELDGGGIIRNNIISTVDRCFSQMAGSITSSNNICYNGDDPDEVGGFITSNPLLNANYTLQAASPAINAGYDLSATFTTDYAGNTRSGTFDIGAYEYGASAVPTGGSGFTLSGGSIQ